MEASGSCSLARIGNASATKGGTDFGNHHAHPAANNSPNKTKNGVREFFKTCPSNYHDPPRKPAKKTSDS
jgi:hypothetical protein